MGWLPKWPVTDSASDTRKWVALMASFGGAVAFTLFASALVWIVWKGGWKGNELERIEILGSALFIVLGGAISANLAFGFVLNRRSFKVSKDGIDISGGDEPSPGPTITTKTETKIQPAPAKPEAHSGGAAADERG